MGESIIYDVRTYELRPGTLNEYMTAVRELGLPIRESHGVKLAGWYYTEIGILNQVIHIWAYQDIEDMENKMQAFRSDPRWVNEYVPRVRDMVVSQTNQVMNAPDFLSPPD